MEEQSFNRYNVSWLKELRADPSSFFSLLSLDLFAFLDGLLRQMLFGFRPSPKYELSKNGTVVTKATAQGKGLFVTAVLSAASFSSGVHEFHLLASSQLFVMEVGFAPASIDPLATDISRKCGWYYYLNAGSLEAASPSHLGPTVNNGRPARPPGVSAPTEDGKKHFWARLDVEGRSISYAGGATRPGTAGGSAWVVCYRDIQFEGPLVFTVLMGYDEADAIELVV